MDLGRATDHELIERIYDAAESPAGWSDVIGRLMAHVPGEQALLNRVTPDDHSIFAFAGHVDPDAAEICQTVYADNVWVRALDDLPHDATFQLDDYVSMRDLRKTGFYADVLRPCGLGRGLTVSILHGSEACYALAIGRSEHGERFAPREVARLGLYARHMRRSLGLTMRFDGLARIRDAAFAALDGLSAAAFLVDADGGTVFANDAGHALARWGAVSLAPGGLRCADRAAAAGFAAAVRAAILGDAPAPVPFADADGGHHVMATAPLGEAAGARITAAGADRPAAAVFVFSAGGPTAPSPETLEALFGLTPAEARAASELALGDGEIETARRLGLSINSLKTHRRRIFEKTGVARQAQLVRLLARLPC